MCEASQQPHRNEPDNGLRPHDLTPDGPILLKFWQIDSMFKCPIIGMCLTGSEQKQLLKKAGISIKNKNPFEIHETLVGSSDDQNRLSTKVDNLLRRKFSRRATFLLDLGYQQFMPIGARFSKPMNFRPLCGSLLHVPACLRSTAKRFSGTYIWPCTGLPIRASS